MRLMYTFYTRELNSTCCPESEIMKFHYIRERTKSIAPIAYRVMESWF